MSEINNAETIEEKVVEVEVAKAPVSSGTTIKDFMVPLSIVIAGMFVGAGLYFGGASAPEAQNTVTQPTPTQPVDNTSKVNPLTADDHIKGNLNAPIKIIEFSDYDCPFCSRFHDVMNNIVAKYPEEVVWAYRHFPLEQLHPQAPAVAVASECVAKLGGSDAFWSFTDGYFADRGAGNNTEHGTLITRLVTAAGIGQAEFTSCFESGSELPAVQADMDDAVETGGRGTPWSILIGPSGKTYPINGALPQQAIEQLIEVAKQEA